MKMGSSANKEEQNRKYAILSLLSLFLLCLLAILVVRVQNIVDHEVILEAGSSENADHSSQYIVYEDVKYPVIRSLSTVLLIGTDNFLEDERQLVEGENRNRNLADFLTILVIDHEGKTITPVQLNRDNMCDVPWLDEKGKVAGTHNEQLAFAHTYGSGGNDSCINTVKAVRGLLYQAPVDHYLAFTMDAVPLMNDLVGGVTVTLNEAIPDLGEEYVKGAEITLKGRDALRYIRYREKSGGTNWFRMKRHRQYLVAFTEAARKAAEENENIVVDAYKKLDPFLCTDLSINYISDLVEWFCEYEMKEIVTPSGDIVPGEEFYEFYVHDSSLWSCVYEAYCRKE